MMHLHSFILFLLFLPRNSRRSLRIGDSHHDAQQQTNAVSKVFEVAGNARQAFFPRGCSMGKFRRHGPQLARLGPRRATITLNASTAREFLVAAMRVAELKAELDERGVSWRGVAFEKEELARLLEDARIRPASAPPSSAPPSSSPAAAASHDEMGEIGGMRVSEIRAELRELGVDCTNLVEKSELVPELIRARREKREDNADVVLGVTQKIPKKGASGAAQGMPGWMGGFPYGVGGFPGGSGGVAQGMAGGMGVFPGGVGGFPGGRGGAAQGMAGGMGGFPGGVGGFPGWRGGAAQGMPGASRLAEQRRFGNAKVRQRP